MMASVMGTQEELTSTLLKPLVVAPILEGAEQALPTPTLPAQLRGLCPAPSSITSPPTHHKQMALAPSFSHPCQGSRKPPMLALWPKVYRNQPVRDSFSVRWEVLRKRPGGTGGGRRSAPQWTA